MELEARQQPVDRERVDAGARGRACSGGGRRRQAPQVGASPATRQRQRAAPAGAAVPGQARRQARHRSRAAVPGFAADQAARRPQQAAGVIAQPEASGSGGRQPRRAVILVDSARACFPDCPALSRRVRRETPMPVVSHATAASVVRRAPRLVARPKSWRCSTCRSPELLHRAGTRAPPALRSGRSPGQHAAVGQDRRLPRGLRLLPAGGALPHRRRGDEADVDRRRASTRRSRPRPPARRASAWARPGARRRTATSPRSRR